MYFDAKALQQILFDEKTAQDAAAAIAATRRRFTSPLAVVETILALSSGADGAEVEARVSEFLDSAGIEVRDMPPSHRLISAAAEAGAGLSAVDVLNRACADYYEAEVFSLAEAMAAAEAAESAAEAAAEAPTPESKPETDI